jgi:hypothetical protein
LPNRDTRDGRRSERTIVASIRIPNPRPVAMTLRSVIGAAAKLVPTQSLDVRDSLNSFFAVR